jgi:hypothetical protein
MLALDLEYLSNRFLFWVADGGGIGHRRDSCAQIGGIARKSPESVSALRHRQERRSWLNEAQQRRGGAFSRPALQAGGRRFDPGTLHKRTRWKQRVSFLAGRLQSAQHARLWKHPGNCRATKEVAG